MLFDDKFPTKANPVYIPLQSLEPSLLAGGAPQPFDLAKEFKGKLVLITAAPGAFTPLCTQAHIPAYLKKEKELKAAGVDRVLILCSNDAFVMNAWAKAEGYNDDLNYFVFASDPNVEISSSLGSQYTVDFRGNGMGIRTLRWGGIIKDGEIKFLGSEPENKYGDIVGVNDMLERIRDINAA